MLVSEWKKTKDKKVLEEIVTNHYSMIYSIINQYTRDETGKDDMLAEGILGILTALNKFDEHKNVKFSTYAYFWIKAKILKFIKTNNPFGREFSSEKIDKLKEESDLQTLEANREHEHFDNLDNVLNHAINIYSNNKAISLDQDFSDAFWSKFVNSKLQLEESTIQEDFSEILKIALLSLSRREQYILEKRWLTDNAMTFEEIAQELGLSAERIRQIEKETFQKIRENLSSKCGSLRGELYFSLLFQHFFQKVVFPKLLKKD